MRTLPTLLAAGAAFILAGASVPSHAVAQVAEETVGGVSEVPTGAVEIARAMIGKPVQSERGSTLGIVTDVEMRMQDDAQITAVIVQPVTSQDSILAADARARIPWSEVTYLHDPGLVRVAMTAPEFAALAGTAGPQGAPLEEHETGLGRLPAE